VSVKAKTSSSVTDVVSVTDKLICVVFQIATEKYALNIELTVTYTDLWYQFFFYIYMYIYYFIIFINKTDYIHIQICHCLCNTYIDLSLYIHTYTRIRTSIKWWEKGTLKDTKKTPWKKILLSDKYKKQKND
jgi:hypothetical protein